MSKKLVNKILTIMKVLFALSLFIFVVFTLYKELANINLKETIHSIKDINSVWLVVFLLIAGLDILVLSMYDVILDKVLHLKISLVNTVRIGYNVNALNAVLGCGGFIGAIVRFFLYTDTTEDKKAL